MDLYYPESEFWLWCKSGVVNLGKFECQGKQYDMGVYIEPMHPNYVSHAIVYGNKPHQYLAGELEDSNKKEFNKREVCLENIRRYKDYLKIKK